MPSTTRLNHGQKAKSFWAKSRGSKNATSRTIRLPHLPSDRAPTRYRFWDRARKTSTPTSQRHMVESLTAYLESVVQQAADRDSNTFRTVDSYLENRRENIGARPSYVPIELDLNLADEVFYHPVIVELSVYIADLIILDNVRLQSYTTTLKYSLLILSLTRFSGHRIL